MRKHPELGKKLLTLYRKRLNPNVISNVELAKKLGVSKQAVSRWCRGTQTQEGDSIPNKQIIPISDVFGIEPLWFTLDYPEFEIAVDSRVSANKSEKLDSKELVSISMLPNTGLDIVGRDEEIMQLNDYWQSNTTNVVQIVAFGGVGKSSLVNKWLSELSKESYRYASRIYAWSFHWQGEKSDVQASGDFFIEHALQWFGDDKPESGTPWSKAIRLARLVRQNRTLILLDGVEVLQNPPGEGVGEIADPALALFVKELAVDNDGLCVLTTRLRIKDLIPYEDGRSETLDLQNLPSSIGVEILKSSGLKGGDLSFQKATETYAGHPLSLSLLAGYISVVHNGDISNFAEIPSLLDEKENRGQVKRIMSSYLDWYSGAAELELLFSINLFDGCVSLSNLKLLVNRCQSIGLFPRLGKFNHPDWSYAVSQLEISRIITVSRTEQGMELDCHPIVRDFLTDKMRTEAIDEYKKAKSALFDLYLDGQIVDSNPSIGREQLFKAVIFGSHAGRYKESFQLYVNKIKQGFVMLADGSHFMDQACLKTFFKDGWTITVDCLDEEEEHYLKSCAAANLVTLGQVDEAITPATEAIKYFVSSGKWKDACQAAGPLISAMIEAGKLGAAIDLLNSLTDVIAYLDNPVVFSLAENFKAYALFLGGDLDGARQHFLEAESHLTVELPKFDIVAPVISAYYGKFLLEIGDCDKAIDRLHEAMLWRKNGAWQVTLDTVSLEASDMLVLGLAFLARGELESAEKYLQKQLELFRSASEWLYLPAGLNSHAKLLKQKKEYSSATKNLEESIDISKRTGAKFGEWEAYLEYADLCLKQQQFEEGLNYLKLADELSGMSSYKFRQVEIDNLRLALEAGATSH